MAVCVPVDGSLCLALLGVLLADVSLFSTADVIFNIDLNAACLVANSC